MLTRYILYFGTYELKSAYKRVVFPPWKSRSFYAKGKKDFTVLRFNVLIMKINKIPIPNILLKTIN